MKRKRQVALPGCRQTEAQPDDKLTKEIGKIKNVTRARHKVFLLQNFNYVFREIAHKAKEIVMRCDHYLAVFREVDHT